MLKDFGLQILDTAGDVVTGFGTNFTAAADSNQAIADRINVENQLALISAQEKAKRNAENDKLMKSVIFVLLAFLGVSIFAFIGFKYFKMKK